MSETGGPESNDEFLLELRKEFLNEVGFLLEDIEESFLRLDDEGAREEELKKIFRVAHSIKGSGQAVGLMDLSGFAHVLEDLLAILRVRTDCVTPDVSSVMLQATDLIKLRVNDLREDPNRPWDVAAVKDQLKSHIARLEGKAVESTIPSAPLAASTSPQSTEKREGDTARGGKSDNQMLKVDVERIEAVMDLVGELLVVKSQMIHHPVIRDSSDTNLNGIVSLLDKTVRSLQDRALGIRMMALKGLFLKAQRIVRDLSLKLDKPTEFRMVGEDTELDRNMIEILQDPLIHLVRNSMDHGIENKDRRASSGKAAQATVTLSARQSNGRVLIEIRDDGGGIPRDRVLAKARKNGLIPETTPDDKFTDQEVFNFLFMPGFSTAEQVSDLSGRGVGLDVVKSNVEKIRGYIEIESALGKGTCFRLSLPLTTAITDGMMIAMRDQIFILPMNGIREIVRFDSKSITTLNDGTEVFNVRGRFYPIVPLRKILLRKFESLFQKWGVSETRDDASKQVLMIVESRGEFYALLVDQILGQTQVVLKNLGNHLDTQSGVSGGAVMGDGNVSLVLDVEGLISEFSNQVMARSGRLNGDQAIHP